MIQLVWLCKIANSYKLDVQIFVWYNFWKIGWVLFLPTYIKETNQSHFQFRNAELFRRKVEFLWKVKKPERWSETKKYGEDERAKRSKWITVHSWLGRIILITIKFLYNSPVDKKPIVVVTYKSGRVSSRNLVFSLGMTSFMSWNISSEFSGVNRNRML